MAEYIDKENFDTRVRLAVGMSEQDLTSDFKDGVSTVLDYFLKTEKKADVIEREKINKAIKEMKLEYLKYDANANKLLADYWMGKAIKILKRNIGESEE